MKPIVKKRTMQDQIDSIDATLYEMQEKLERIEWRKNRPLIRIDKNATIWLVTVGSIAMAFFEIWSQLQIISLLTK